MSIHVEISEEAKEKLKKQKAAFSYLYCSHRYPCRNPGHTNDPHPY